MSKKFYEVNFCNFPRRLPDETGEVVEYAMCIRATRLLTTREADILLQNESRKCYDNLPVVRVFEISREEAFDSFDMEGYEKHPVFGRDIPVNTLLPDLKSITSDILQFTGLQADKKACGKVTWQRAIEDFVVNAANNQVLLSTIHKMFIAGRGIVTNYNMDETKTAESIATKILEFRGKYRLTAVKTGHWINPSQNSEYVNREFFSDCSECGYTTSDETDACPNCGTKMVL